MSNQPLPPLYGGSNPPIFPMNASLHATYTGPQQQNDPNAGAPGYWSSQRGPSDMGIAQGSDGFLPAAYSTSTNGHPNPSGTYQPPFNGHSKIISNAADTFLHYPSVPYSFPPTSSSIPNPPNPHIHDLRDSRPTAAIPDSFSNLAPRFTVSDDSEGRSHLLDSAAPELEDGEISSGEQSNVSGEIYAITPEPPRQALQSGSGRNISSRDLVYQGVNVTDEEATRNKTLLGSISDKKSSGSNQSILQQAESLLRELQTYNVELQDLITEGFDAKLLRILFAHIGVSVEPINIPPHEFVTSHHLNDNKTSDLSLKTQPDYETVSSPRPNHPLYMTQSQHSATTAKLSHPSDDPKQADQISEATTPSDIKLGSSNPGGKTGHKSTELKTVDRKAYIARMLAAKTGKVVSGSGASSDTLKPSSEPSSAVHTHSPAPDTPTNPDQPSNLESRSSPNITVQSSTLNSGLEAKKRAQTELARQKMEALKNQREAQVKNQVRMSPRPMSSDNVSPTRESPSSEAPEATTGLPVRSNPTPVPRQASYFSPVSLKPAFNLPGLFSSSADTTTRGQINEDQPLSEAEGTEVGVTMAAQHGGKDSALKDSVTGSKTPRAASDYKPGSGSRKRQQAADYIDLPSTKTRKTFSHSEENSVVIDVSDDEDSDTLGSLSRLEGGNLGSVRKPPIQENADNHRREYRIIEKPALEQDIPLPPPLPLLSQGHGKSQEPEVLRSKEMEIEQMNRKIAELEQRIRAKQTSGPTQSSSQLATAASMQSVLNSTQGNEGNERAQSAPKQSKASPVQSLNSNTPDASLLEARSTIDTVANTGQGSTPALAENVSNRVEPSSDISTVEFGESLASVVNEATSRSFQHQTGEPSSTKASLARDDSIRKRSQLESNLADLGKEIAEIEVSLQLRKAEMDRLRTNLNNMQHHRKQLSQELASLDKALSPEQNGLRQMSLNNLDVQGTKQVDNYDSEKPNSFLGTQPNSLQQESKAPISNSVPDFTADRSDATQSDTGPTESANMLSPVTDDGQDDGQDIESSGLDDAAIEKSSDEELDEDGMDISRSEMDEGELSEDIQIAGQDPADAMDTSEEDDFYEPPNEVLTQSEDQVAAGLSRPPLTEIPPNPISWKSAALSSGELVSQGSNRLEASITNDKAQMGTDPDTLSRTEAAENESDDYEPPEPSVVPEKSALSVDRNYVADTNDGYAKGAAQINEDPSFKPVSSEPRDDSEATSRLPEVLPKDNNTMGDSFTPYQSPLRYFKSYRFHPDFLKDVTNGFRSLTYSNAINPQNPICQYEFGGVCNDESCANQHFHKMGLSDDIILREIGISEGSTPEEKNNYKAGLRDLVLDLRRRKVKDMDAIASEISNYRAKFLGDAPKRVPR